MLLKSSKQNEFLFVQETKQKLQSMIGQPYWLKSIDINFINNQYSFKMTITHFDYECYSIPQTINCIPIIIEKCNEQ
jgi:hypothetical protein